MANPRVPLSLVDPGALAVRDPPRPLKEHGRRLWDAVMATYQIDDPGGTELLALACEATDRAVSLSARIAQDGEVIYTKTGLRANPLLRDELGCRAFIAKTIEKLGLTLEPLGPVGRPPGPRKSRGHE